MPHRLLSERGHVFCLTVSLTVSLTHQMCVIMCIIQFNMDQWGWSFLDAKPRPMLNLSLNASSW